MLFSSLKSTQNRFIGEGIVSIDVALNFNIMNHVFMLVKLNVKMLVFY